MEKRIVSLGRKWAAAAVALLFLACPLRAAEPAAPDLSRALDAALAPLRGRQDGDAFVYDVKATIQDMGGGAFRFARHAADAFTLTVEHSAFGLVLHRDADVLWLHIPSQNVLFLGEGPGRTDADALLPDKLSNRIAAEIPEAQLVFGMLPYVEGQSLLGLFLASGGKIETENGEGEIRFTLRDRRDRPLGRLDVADGTLKRIQATVSGTTVDIVPAVLPAEAPSPLPAAGNTVKVDRAEMELALARCIGRGIGLLYDKAAWEPPADRETRGPGGVYRVKNGQRLVALRGTPAEIGRQHGQFLAPEVRRITDTVLYVVGTGYSVMKGKWFLDEIRSARDRCEPFMPPAHLEEIRAIAEGANVPFEELRLASYFPEMFHCSGFALAGKATADGRLYHGRVLDYMAGVGIQCQAVVFYIETEGKIPWVNVAYAGFAGSVTGMNADGIALGEMGGRGEGDWDGMPMTALMRAALEDARTLADVKRLFAETPRTCEYYYVFSDGKDNTAVGVYATPKEILFLEQGGTHPQLPEAFEDSVLLSAGKRYEALCGKVREGFGGIDARAAMALMDYPVAMKDSNMHNVLMIPASGEFWVQNAGRNRPAYREPWHAYTLAEMKALLEGE